MLDYTINGWEWVIKVNFKVGNSTIVNVPKVKFGKQGTGSIEKYATHYIKINADTGKKNRLRALFAETLAAVCNIGVMGKAQMTAKAARLLIRKRDIEIAQAVRQHQLITYIKVPLI